MVLVFVKQPNGTTISVDVKFNDSVKRLKKMISRSIGASSRKQKLLFGGQLLQNDKKLHEYNITKECMIQLLVTKSASKTSNKNDSNPNDSNNNSNNNGHNSVERRQSVSKGLSSIQLIEHSNENNSSVSTSQGASVVSTPLRSNAAKHLTRTDGKNVFSKHGGSHPNSSRKYNNILDSYEAYQASPYLQFGDLILVQLIEAKALKKSDFWTDSSDPYCLIVLNNSSAKSKVIQRNVDPQWNQMFVFLMDVAPSLQPYENAGMPSASFPSLNNAPQFSNSSASMNANVQANDTSFPSLSKQQRKKLMFLRRERAKLRDNMKHRRKLPRMKSLQGQATNADVSAPPGSMGNDASATQNTGNNEVSGDRSGNTGNMANGGDVGGGAGNHANHANHGNHGNYGNHGFRTLGKAAHPAGDDIGPDSCILSFLVFDEDTFTPDDFLGSAEIRLDNIPYDTVTDMWVPLTNADTGHIHIKLRKCILASPMHRSIVKKLSRLQRGITVKDLQMNNISLDQLIGQEAYICENLSNPAIEHLVSVLLANKIEWNLSSLHRIETILTSQHMLPTHGVPTRYIWISGLSFSNNFGGSKDNVSGRDAGSKHDDRQEHGLSKENFLLAMEQYATPKRCFIPKFNNKLSFAVIEFKSIKDALFVFITFQHKKIDNNRMLLGFGRRVVYNKDFLSKVILAGFLNVFHDKIQGWQFCWCFMTRDSLLCFDNLQSEDALLTISLKNVVVLSRGLISLELFDIVSKQSCFLYNHKVNDMKVWSNKLKHCSINCNPNSIQYKIFQIPTTSTTKPKTFETDTPSISEREECIKPMDAIPAEPTQPSQGKTSTLEPPKASPGTKMRRKSDSYAIRYFSSKSKKNQVLPSNPNLSEDAANSHPSDPFLRTAAASASAHDNTVHSDALPASSQAPDVPSKPLFKPVPSHSETSQTLPNLQNVEKNVENMENMENAANVANTANVVNVTQTSNTLSAEAVDVVNDVLHENDVYVECYRCGRHVSVDSVLSPDYQLKPSCISCLRAEILASLERKDYKRLISNYSIQDLIELLSGSEFNCYLDLSLHNLLETGDYFVQCPNERCKSLWEFIHGDSAVDAPDFSRVTGISNKLLDEEAQRHYLSHRVCCRQCGTNFCRSCMATPYHSGFNCKVYELYKNAEKCRFCGVALMPDVVSCDAPSKALTNVCNNELCLTKRDQTCVKHLECGHVCTGVRDEEQCMCCIESGCEARPRYVTQSLDDYCNICFTETLAEAPCMELDCGHVFHYQCVLQRVKEKWNPPRITFNFMNCPLCKVRISHPLLDAMECVKEMQALHRDLEQRAHFQLKEESMLQDKDVTEEKGDYYNNVVGYGMAKLSFYNCFVCNKPYYGGLARCMDALENVKESDFICPACSGIGLDSCQIHGKDYMVYKCRFCCKVANYFCWGTTHFCHDCHKKQENHDFMTTKKKEDLEQCKGPADCPLRVDHPPNGEEFSLGCSLCRGSDSFFQGTNADNDNNDNNKSDANLIIALDNPPLPPDNEAPNPNDVMVPEHDNMNNGNDQSDEQQ